MKEEYKSDTALCVWLRENSSGNYRLSAYAADRIETLNAHLSNVKYECEQLSAMEKAAPDMLEALELIIATWDGPLYKHEMAPNIDKARKAIAKAKGEGK